MARHSPQLALSEARTTLAIARETCPHWDYESDGEGHACCNDVEKARASLRAAERAVLRQSAQRP